MRQHLMLDFETLGTDPDAIVLSLGAVLFNQIGMISDRHYFFKIDEQFRRRKASGATLVWWLDQHPEAKSVFKKTLNGWSIETVLNDLSNMIAGTEVCVWGNGATFDISIIDDLFRNEKEMSPWKYSNVRCYRTVKAMHGIEKGKERVGTRHDALADAKWQAHCLQQFLRANPELDK